MRGGRGKLRRYFPHFPHFFKKKTHVEASTDLAALHRLFDGGDPVIGVCVAGGREEPGARLVFAAEHKDVLLRRPFICLFDKDNILEVDRPERRQILLRLGVDDRVAHEHEPPLPPVLHRRTAFLDEIATLLYPLLQAFAKKV